MSDGLTDCYNKKKQPKNVTGETLNRMDNFYSYVFEYWIIIIGSIIGLILLYLILNSIL